MNKTLIIISAIWCTSCLIVSNNFKKIINDYPLLNIVNLDFDLDTDKVNRYTIGSTLPVIILEDEYGNEINRLIGEKTSNEIRNFLDSNL